MKVRDLITLLEVLDEDLPIIMNSDMTGKVEVTHISIYLNVDDEVVLSLD